MDQTYPLISGTFLTQWTNFSQMPFRMPPMGASQQELNPWFAA